MIPQTLKWVGAVIGLLILVVVAAPLAVDAIFGTIEFDDQSGLFETDDPDPLDDLDVDPDDVEDLEGSELDGEAESGEGEVETEAEVETEDAEIVTEGDEGAEADDEPSGETYVVEGGDTLYSIAQEVYGDGNRWSEIAEANGIGDQSALTVGQELEIP